MKAQNNNEVYIMKEHTRLALVEQVVGQIGETLVRIEKRLDTLDRKTEEGFSKIDSRITKLDEKVDSNFKWLIGTMITLFLTVGFGVLFKGGM